MDLEELIVLFNCYQYEVNEYQKELDQAIENGNRSFADWGADQGKRAAYIELEKGLNTYIDRRIEYYLAGLGLLK